MQIQIFTIPVYNNEEELKEMNSFLLSQRVLEISENFVSNTKGTFWCYSVRYIKKASSKGYNQFLRKAKVDYQTILDKKTYEIFSTLRKYRQELAKNDSVPAYAVFTDVELVEISKLSDINIPNMKKIEGIGQRKIEKYAEKLIKMCKNNETNGELNK